jgi:predicted PurR-regulated permease PerM
MDPTSPTDPHQSTSSNLPSGSTAELQTLPVAIANVHAGRWALNLMAILATVFALSFAQKFLIPLVFSLLLAYTLNPVVNTLQKLGIPRIVGTSALLFTIVSALLLNMNPLVTEFDSILLQIPNAARKLTNEFAKQSAGEVTLIQKVQVAANEIESVAGRTAGESTPSKKQIAIESPTFNIRQWLLLGSISVFGLIGEAVVILFLVFFLLVAGDKFRRKLVKLTPSFTNKRIAVRVLNQVNASIQRYTFMLFITNAMITLLSWAAFRMLGLENAGAWAVAAGLLHVVPYFGVVMIAVVTSLAGFLQFGTLSMGLAVGGSALLIATLVGTFIATWMTGKIAKMNMVAVFVGLLFWGWLWGAWGLLLGAPIMVVVKVLSEHVVGLEAVAELLGD